MEEINTESINSPSSPQSSSTVSAIVVTHTPGLADSSVAEADPVSQSGPLPPRAEELSRPIEPLVQLAPHPLSDTSSSSSSSTLVLEGVGQSSTRSPEASSSAAARLLPESSPILEHVAQVVPSGIPAIAPVDLAANSENQPTCRQTSHEPIRIRGTGHITLQVYSVILLIIILFHKNIFSNPVNSSVQLWPQQQVQRGLSSRTHRKGVFTNEALYCNQ
jgi:hypothetical protein